MCLEQRELLEKRLIREFTESFREQTGKMVRVSLYHKTKNGGKMKSARVVSLEQIYRAVASEVGDGFEKSRKHKFTLGKTCFSLFAHLQGYLQQEIASRLGLTNRATISYHIGTGYDLLKVDENFQGFYHRVEQMLRIYEDRPVQRIQIEPYTQPALPIAV
jgi:hypothetical protein